jgi:Ras family protein A
MELVLYDTAGQEDYELLRPLSYPNTDVVIICFSVDNPDSFDNVMQTWVPEVKHFCTGTPILLVATKSDLRQDKVLHKQLAARQLKVVTTEQGITLANKLGAYAYMECSAKTRVGVEEVFETAAKVALSNNRKHRQRKQNKQCVIL